MQVLKQFIKEKFGSWLYHGKKSPARKKELEEWVNQFEKRSIAQLSDVSFNVFTYHGEDGILLYLINRLEDIPKTFIDIGSGDCIKSNCANLITHFGWEGVFVDKNNRQLTIGKNFYKDKQKQGVSIRFIEAEVTTGNVNEVVSEEGWEKKIGLLSIDIDGNDYWIWKAIESVQPEIVLIEAKVEFGYKSIAVPYSSSNHHTVDKMYNGASVEAIRKLGLSKGYKLVGANKQGYNLFFVKLETAFPEVSAESILSDPETIASFYGDSFFESHKFEVI